MEQAESESDDDEQQIYNPLKLPMGWDGKPIPYWLYKLHGLGQVPSPRISKLFYTMWFFIYLLSFFSDSIDDKGNAF